MPANLDRRFEAIVFDWDPLEQSGRPWDAKEFQELVGGLCEKGMDLALVSTRDIETIDRQIQVRPAGPGRLYLIVECGVKAFFADAQGVRAMPQVFPTRGSSPLGPPVVIGEAHHPESLRWIVQELWSRGIGPGLVLVAGDAITTDGFLALLKDQLRRRDELPRIDRDPGWVLSVVSFDPFLERAHESLLTMADGLIGTSGIPLASHPATEPRVLVASQYHGDGPETQLLHGPIWNRLGFELRDRSRLERSLDLHTGVLEQQIETDGQMLRAVEFSSLAHPGTVGLRLEARSEVVLAGSPLLEPDQGGSVEAGTEDGIMWMRAGQNNAGVLAAARDASRDFSGGSMRERLAVYQSGRSAALPEVLEQLAEVERRGFNQLLAEHRQAWARRWDEAGIVLEGDPDLEFKLRFALFHLMGSVADCGEAAVGARGLTGPAYRGHVFWDSDVFVLPFFAATHPSSARAMLEYRIRRLPASMEAARAQGLRGARFPWESAAAGKDVTPGIAHDRTGRRVLIRTGQLEEHIVADVAWASSLYADWTGEMDFIQGPGAAILVETARYWASRIRMGKDHRAHLYGVIGPDEYHEPVDDNAFTNVMARWNLKRAARWPGRRAAGASDTETREWLELASALVDGYDAVTRLYEQFEGFFRLEPLIISEVAPRRPIAADLMLGRERVQGAQIVKQADVLMLHHMVPEEVEPSSLLPNLLYYEPRTAHGSSLSPGVHAALTARAGRLDQALETLQVAARIDLDDLTGTTAGGLHLGTMGGLWQAVAFGFAGIRARSDALIVDPQLPHRWTSLEIPLRFRGAGVRLRIDREGIQVCADREIRVFVPGAGTFSAGPGRRHLRPVRDGWEVTS